MLTVYAIGRPKVLVRTRRGNCQQFILLLPFLGTCIFFSYNCSVFAPAPNIISYILVSFKLVVYNFFYSYFYYFFPLLHSPWRVLRWMHTLQQPSASIGFLTHCITSFSTLIQYLLSFFRKACCHSTASAFGSCAGKQTCFFVERNLNFITYSTHF